MYITKGRPALVLAPMDGITDALMRRLLTSVMPFSYCVTEFLRISALVPPEHVFRKTMPELECGARTASGAPVELQLLGGDPERLAESASRAVSCGAQGIDLNFGCPAPTVNRHDGGATLLKHPERIEAIVRAVRSAVPLGIPVSAKLRLGWDDPEAIQHNAERAARGGAAWITIHGRTKMQGYTPPAYWEPIGRVRAALNIPVVANGEIWSVDDLRRCQDQSGCEHFMVGRGALANLTLVRDCALSLGLSPATEGLGASTLGWLGIMRALSRLSREYGEADRRTCARMKQWLNYAHKRRSIDWFDSVKQAKCSRDLLILVERATAMRTELFANCDPHAASGELRAPCQSAHG
jgi:tRNA-dihydrouridine synthase C